VILMILTSGAIGIIENTPCSSTRESIKREVFTSLLLFLEVLKSH